MNEQPAAEAAPIAYRFGGTFQKNILACMARDPSFLAEVSDAIRPVYFTTHPMVVLARIMLEYYEAQHARPDYATLWHKVNEQVAANDLGEALLSGTQDLLRELWMIEIPEDVEYYRQEVAKFGREQAIKVALLEAVEHMEQHGGEPEKHHEIMSMIQRALIVGTGQSRGIQLFDDPLHPSTYRDALADPKRKVRFGIPSLDSLSLGGLGAGELAVLLGATGAGKSMLLTNIAAKAAHRGARVLYISTEMTPYQIATRALATISGKSIHQVADEASEFQAAMAQLVSEKRYMRILHLRPHSPVGKLRAMIARVEAYDRVRPDYIAVDYADELAPTRKGGEWDGSYQAFGDVYSELIAIAEDWECPLITAAQVNRTGYLRRGDADDFPGIEHMSDSMKKAHLAHFILSMAQTPDEKARNELRLKIVKYRLGPSGEILRCIADWSKCYLRQKQTELTDAQPQPIGVAPHGIAGPSPAPAVGAPAAAPHAVPTTPTFRRPMPVLQPAVNGTGR